MRGRFWWVTTTITGPNDASGVVWAFGMRFFKILRVYFILTL